MSLGLARPLPRAGMISFDVVRWRALESREREAWRAFRLADPGLRSPLFDLHWFDAVDEARGDLQVLRGRRGPEPVAFLPFHPGLAGTARMAGDVFSEWHGFVAAPGARLDAREALRRGPATLRFTLTPTSDPVLAPHAEAADVMHAIDFVGGWAAYARPAGRAAPKGLQSIRRAGRKLEADGRAAEIVVRDSRPEALAAMMAGKSRQLRAKRQFDIYAAPWSRRFMAALLRRRSDEFEAVLSSLRVDCAIAATRLDVRSGAVVHDLVNAYDEALQPYMPGHLLRGEALRALADDGVREHHFGSGDYAWKRELANTTVPFVSGVVHAASAQGRFNAAAFALGRRWSKLPLGPAARAPHGLSWRLERGLSRRAPPPTPA